MIAFMVTFHFSPISHIAIIHKSTASLYDVAYGYPNALQAQLIRLFPAYGTMRTMRLDGVFLCPPLFTSIWLWLYVGSGFLLKAARRFDLGFDWFNRKFDIEKKPLQSIGLVAGALVALVYWAAVIVSRVVG
jgi:hypothetical protein